MRFLALMLTLLAGEATARAEVLDRVVAEVGDQPILWSELQTRAHLSSPRGEAGSRVLSEQEQQTLHDTLSQLIDEQMILQAEPTVATSPEEIDLTIREIGSANQLTSEQVFAAAQQQGISRPQYLAAVERQLRLIRATNVHLKHIDGKIDGPGALERAQKEWLTELRRTSYFAILPSNITPEPSPAAEVAPEPARQQAACSAATFVLHSFAPPAPAVVTSGPVKRFVLLGSSSPAVQAALAGDANALDPARVSDTLRRLWALGLLAQIEIRAEATPDGRQIVYHVVERPPVRAVFITGNPATDPAPRDELKTHVAAPPRPGVLLEDAQLLRTHYQKRGYIDAAVRPRWLVSGGEVDVCFTITPGRRVVLKEIALRNNHVLSSALLQTVLPPAGATNGRGGVYDKEGLDESLQRITDLCYDRGMINARVSARTEPLTPDGHRLIVEVNEGAVYTLEPLVLEGAPPALRPQLEAQIALKPGEVFNRTRVMAARGRAVAFLAAKGYSNVQGEIATEIKAPKNTIQLTLKLSFAAPSP